MRQQRADAAGRRVDCRESACTATAGHARPHPEAMTSGSGQPTDEPRGSGSAGKERRGQEVRGLRRWHRRERIWVWYLSPALTSAAGTPMSANRRSPLTNVLCNNRKKRPVIPHESALDRECDGLLSAMARDSSLSRIAGLEHRKTARINGGGEDGGSGCFTQSPPTSAAAMWPVVTATAMDKAVRSTSSTARAVTPS